MSTSGCQLPLSPYFLRHSFKTRNQEPTSSASLVGNKLPGSPACLCLPSAGVTGVPPHLTLYVGTGTSTQILTFVWQVLYPCSWSLSLKASLFSEVSRVYPLRPIFSWISFCLPIYVDWFPPKGDMVAVILLSHLGICFLTLCRILPSNMQHVPPVWYLFWPWVHSRNSAM